MLQPAPASADDPVPSVPGRPAYQLRLDNRLEWEIEDPEWVAFIIRRLAAGDVITIERDGNLLITDP
jgi:hypothetical protein